MTTVVGMNEKDTISTAVAKGDLQHVLVMADPDYAALQEWNRVRDAVTQQVCDELGYRFARPANGGGGPVLWKATAGSLRACRALRLARSEFVGHLPGRRSRLGPSWCTEAIIDDALSAGPDGSQTVILNYHLTAEVQDVRGGGGYKKDPAHWLRVMRHKREKRRLGRRARFHLRRGRRVFAIGDSNFSGMTIGRFHNNWDGVDGGDLGGRAVTIIFSAAKPAKRPRVFKTHSDHRAVAVTYGGN